jgi:mannose-6-phosphate isomerase-like protein (cupin superfamily)
MRALPIALLLLTAAMSPTSWAQAPETQAEAAIKTFASSADIADLIAKAKAERKEGQAVVFKPILSLAPYHASLEYRAGLAPAQIHEKDAELMVVLDGAGTITTGGTLVDEKRTNAANLSGSGITGGTVQALKKGDVLIVPEKVPHQTKPAEGQVIVLMTFHVPRRSRGRERRQVPTGNHRRVGRRT